MLGKELRNRRPVTSQVPRPEKMCASYSGDGTADAGATTSEAAN